MFKVFVVLACVVCSVLAGVIPAAPAVVAPAAYAAAPVAAAYARTVPYNVLPFASAVNIQTRAVAAPLTVAALPSAYSLGPAIAPAAYTALPYAPTAIL